MQVDEECRPLRSNHRLPDVHRLFIEATFLFNIRSFCTMCRVLSFLNESRWVDIDGEVADHRVTRSGPAIDHSRQHLCRESPKKVSVMKSASSVRMVRLPWWKQVLR